MERWRIGYDRRIWLEKCFQRNTVNIIFNQLLDSIKLKSKHFDALSGPVGCPCQSISVDRWKIS
jgi:hypothetical protein